MPAVTPLICAACGSQLKPTSERDRYHCPRCGTEHLVERHSQPTSAAASSSAAPVAAGVAQPVPTRKRDTSGALIELLDRVPDANALETLLEPVNLLKLMLLYGWTEGEIKQQLSHGKVPGELLLELLHREPDANALLQKLGKPAMPAHGTASSAGDVASNVARFSPRVSGGIYMACGITLLLGFLLSFLWLSGVHDKLQIVLLCAAPVLILMGMFQLITNQKILK